MHVSVRMLLAMVTGYSTTASSQRQKTVNIAVLLPRESSYLFSQPRVVPALVLAVESIRNRSDLLPGYRLLLHLYDSECSDDISPLRAIQAYMAGMVDVYLGPHCDFGVAPVARLAPHWGKPLITAGALVHAFGNKTQFRSLTRISGSYAKVANFFTSIFFKFEFFHPMLIYETHRYSSSESDCKFMMEAIYFQFNPHHKRSTKRWYDGVEYDPTPGYAATLRLALQAASDHSRVVVLCASPNSIREIMIAAHELNFDNGEYVFFNIDLFSSRKETLRPWYKAGDADERNAAARLAYDALMTVTLRKPDNPEYRKFSEDVKLKSRNNSYMNYTYEDEEVNSFVGAFHDAVILYSLALTEALREGFNQSDGLEITHRMWNRTFQGITGNVSIDPNGDRNADYSLLDLNRTTGNFQVVAHYFGSRGIYEAEPSTPISWPGPKNAPPPDVPICGFDNSKCLVKEGLPSYVIILITLVSLCVVIFIASFVAYRYLRPIDELSWRIRWEDIDTSDQLQRTVSNATINKRTSLVSADTVIQTVGLTQTRTGVYKGSIVALKSIHRTSINISKPQLLEFKRIRDLQNEHIVRLLGICIDFPDAYIVTEYCPKGSLQDLLQKPNLKLDFMFKSSLIQDIVRGMCYLAGSEVRSHGNLTSSNCVVDNRFVCKIADFGLHEFRDRGKSRYADDPEGYYMSKLWTAPELLRNDHHPPEGSQKGDVYSFAVICQEIIYRKGPFWVAESTLTFTETCRRLKDPTDTVYRPTLETGVDCTEELATLLRKCWAEDPAARPDFTTAKSVIRRINRENGNENMLDNLRDRMEQHANNLEELVAERTAEYEEQKKRAEDLLYMMLPRMVAEQLMVGQAVTAEKFESVSIYFSDIVGFTALSSGSSPMQVVDLLNDLYTTFDSIIGNHDVYKVETIGDAYMVASGLPERNGSEHAAHISRMSLALLNAVRSFKIRHRPEKQLELRIGVHSGPCVAGVVGLTMPRYCLFGDTVNTASRMESTGQAHKIHISPCTKEILDTFQNFVLTKRGLTKMKGKEDMVTWWLEGEHNPRLPDLAPINY